MPWTAAVTITIEDSRMDLPVGQRRPAGTILTVSDPARKGGFGPNTILGLIDVTGIPDRITLDSLRASLTIPWEDEIGEDVVITAFRDRELVFADLPLPQQAILKNPLTLHRGTMTWGAFMAATMTKRNGRRRLVDGDVG